MVARKMLSTGCLVAGWGLECPASRVLAAGWRDPLSCLCAVRIDIRSARLMASTVHNLCNCHQCQG